MLVHDTWAARDLPVLDATVGLLEHSYMVTWYVFKVTPEARRAVGQWPSAEALADRLAAELGAAARQEADGERQGLLSYAARLIGDTLREATVRAAGAVLAPAFGGIPVPEKGQPVPPPEPRPDIDVPGLAPLPERPELLRQDRPAPTQPAKIGSSDEPESGDDLDSADTDMDLPQSREDAKAV